MLLKVVMDIFQEVGKDIGPFGEKEHFWENFFPKSPKPRMCPKGTTAAFRHFPLDSTEDQIFFPKSFFYTLVMWRALKSGYGHFRRGREGYRTIWRKKNFLENFFPKVTTAAFGTFLLDSTEDKFFFQNLSFIP